MDATEIFSPYASVAMTAKQELQKVEQKLEAETNGKKRAILKKQRSGLKHLIDRCFRLTGDFLSVHVSKRASQYCAENQLGDLFAIGWGEQPKFEKQPNRSSCKLKHEHKIPVATLVERIKATSTLEEAVRLFEAQEIVWIHKDEDRKLPKSKRPNPDEEYEKAGIEIIKNPKGLGHLFE